MCRSIIFSTIAKYSPLPRCPHCCWYSLWSWRIPGCRRSREVGRCLPWSSRWVRWGRKGLTRHAGADGVVDGGAHHAAVAVLRAGWRGGNGGKRQVQVHAGQSGVVKGQQAVHKLRPGGTGVGLKRRTIGRGERFRMTDYLHQPAALHYLVKVLRTLKRDGHSVAILIKKSPGLNTQWP